MLDWNLPVLDLWWEMCVGFGFMFFEQKLLFNTIIPGISRSEP
jgi:hypothetical protein